MSISHSQPHTSQQVLNIYNIFFILKKKTREVFLIRTQML